jgi:3-hydroxyisobutyrate dehydrogenase-like beta-hydroxyacid dehydrogenase
MCASNFLYVLCSLMRCALTPLYHYLQNCPSNSRCGAQIAGSAKECAQGCDITFACVSDPEAAIEVATGANGVAAGMSEGASHDMHSRA